MTASRSYFFLLIVSYITLNFTVLTTACVKGLQASKRFHNFKLKKNYFMRHKNYMTVRSQCL